MPGIMCLWLALLRPQRFGHLPVQDESGTVYDEAGVAEDMLQFLTEFRDAHDSYFMAPLFITGESYGGTPLGLAACDRGLPGLLRVIKHAHVCRDCQLVGSSCAPGCIGCTFLMDVQATMCQL